LISKNRLLLSLEKQTEDGESSEWSGFVQTMKTFIKKQLTGSDKKLQEFVKAKVGGIKTTITTMQGQMHNDIGGVKTEISFMKKDMTNIKDLIKEVIANQAK